jgi:transcriptional regulator GlxA family with amidase domain
MGAHDMGYTPNKAELDFIRKSFDDCAGFLTICGGFQAPLMAGLYHGKSATAPQPMLGMLKKTAPDVEWVDQRWHRDGKLWTSGTLLNGTDLMRAFATDIWGGKGSLASAMLDIGGFPKRDVDYKDA